MVEKDLTYKVHFQFFNHKLNKWLGVCSNAENS